MKRLVALAALAAGCSYAHVAARAPEVPVFSRYDAPAKVAPRTRRLFVLVPGILGWGWEWDEALAMLRAAPDVTVEAFEWAPSASLARSAADFARRLDELLATLPPGVTRVVVVAHSAAGLIAAHAAAKLHLPPGRTVEFAVVGAPYAGLHASPVAYTPDNLDTPFAIALGGTFARYPAPVPGVRFESWVTDGARDPVMASRFGHDPGDPQVGPPGPRHRLPTTADHNRVLAQVVRELLAR